jgi:hypothetical protein
MVSLKMLHKSEVQWLWVVLVRIVLKWFNKLQNRVNNCQLL